MKNKMIIVVAAILALSAVSAFAAESRSECANGPAMQQFMKQTASLRAALVAKDTELARANTYGGIERGYDGPDQTVLSQLQQERKEITEKINAAAKESGIRTCCL